MRNVMGMIDSVVDIRTDISMDMAMRFHGFDNGADSM